MRNITPDQQEVLAIAIQQDPSPLKEAANTLKEFYTKYGEGIESVKYNGGLWIIASTLPLLKINSQTGQPLSSNDFYKHYIPSLTTSGVGTRLLEGIQKVTSTALSDLKEAFEEQRGHKPTWNKASSIYICTWNVACHYLVQGASEVSVELSNIFSNITQAKSEAISNAPESKGLLDFGILDGMVSKLKQVCGLTVENKNSIVENKSSIVKVHTIATSLDQRLTTLEEEKKEAENWVNFKSFKSRFKLDVSQSANTILSHAVKTELTVRGIETKLCSNTEHITYPLDLLQNVCRELKREQILHFNKDPKGSIWLVRSEREIQAELSSTEWTDPNLGNGYDGVHVTSKVLNFMCNELTKRLEAAFPKNNSFANNGYIKLYDYIKSKFGYKPNYAKKAYGIEEAAGTKVIYNRRHAGVACAFLTKELQKYPEVKPDPTPELQEVFDSKARMQQIRAAEQEKS